MACRVEKIEVSANASWDEKNNAHKRMMGEFKKKLDSARVMNDIKRREFYESPGVERRRKKKESENQRLQTQMREKFPLKRKADKDKDKENRRK